MKRSRLLSLLWAAVLVAAAAAPAAAQAPARSVLAFDQVVDGPEDQEIRWPSAVAADDAGDLAVADAWTPRVLVFTRKGADWQLEKAVGLPGAPAAMAWDGGRFVVSLRGGQGLVALEGEQYLLRKLALPAGTVPGPVAAAPEGGVLVFDLGRGRVVHLDGDGAVVSDVPVDGRVTGLAAGPAGTFYTAVAERAVIRRHGADGAVQETWPLPGDGPQPAWPVGIAVEPDGDLMVLDRHTERVVVMDPTGAVKGFGARHGWEPGLLLFPAGIAVFPDGRVVVADQGNGRAQIYERLQGSERP
jgi:DNA-binding beta-propeller fold protein YncE